ncbi:MAG: putative Ig domain-containing protein [Gemmatimonadota bacterium]|nr:MAG: putative Ig domain-containing protein [Gemmatimonadota bacterium]
MISGRLFAMIAICVIIILSTSVMLHAESFLDYAEGAAEWLMNEARVDGNGYKWPDVADGGYHSTDLYYGSPGIVKLFSRLYETTGKEQYRHYATGGAQWLIDEAVPEGGGYKWPMIQRLSSYGIGFYTGVTGTGDAFADLYEIFSDTRYLNHAMGAADWLLHVAVFEGPDICKWPYTQNSGSYYTDIIGGVAGVGLFLLRMYELDGNQKYLEYARYGGNWLVSQAIPDGNGYKWKMSTGSHKIFTGFSHGAAGIGYFLAELFRVSGDDIYLEYAKGAAQWLMDVAIETEHECTWWSEESERSVFFSTGWCHGPAGTCLIFMKLYAITTEERYLAYAEKGANWSVNVAIPDGGGYRWPYTVASGFSDVTFCHGVTGVGKFLLDFYTLTRNEHWLKYAKGAAFWLGSIADTSAGGYRWESFDFYNTGYSLGTAGIGLFFLDNMEYNWPPIIKPITEQADQYYNTAPILSTFGFYDDMGLVDGWYQIDSYEGTWTILFSDISGTSWDKEDWSIPGFSDLPDGSHTIYFKASDDSGAVEGESGEWSWQFFKDTTPPSAGTISIQNGADTINSLMVSLDALTASDTLSGLSQMQFSNDGNNWSSHEEYSPTRPDWDLSAYGGNHFSGTKRVCVKYKDVAGNWSESFSDETVCILPLAIVTDSLTNGIVGVPYNQTLEAWGGWHPYRWNLEAGSLPLGLTFDTTGVIAGVPNASDTISLTLKVTDSTSAICTQDLELTITEGYKGDINGDGQINIIDVVRLVNSILNNRDLTPNEHWTADCNGDGSVDILDALGIINVILGVGECEP